MKKTIFLLAFYMLLIVGCSPATQDRPTEAEVSVFKKNVSTFQIWKKSHELEDIDMFMDILADSLQWSPPNYEGEILGKKELKAALSEVYFPLFENIQFTEGEGLPYPDAPGYWGGSTFSSRDEMALSFNPNSLRVYGLWTAKHSETGTPIQFKWFALIDFNEDGKIVKFSDYMDVTGVLMQLTTP